MAVREWGLPFPRLSDDEFEQWLVAEAVMSRYHDMVAERERLQRRRAEVEQQKADWLAAKRERAAAGG